MTALCIEQCTTSEVKEDTVTKIMMDWYRILTLPERMHAFESSRLDALARQQGIKEPTDWDVVYGELEGAIDDDFLEAIRRQRERH
jgi:hypothetical protein